MSERASKLIRQYADMLGMKKRKLKHLFDQLDGQKKGESLDEMRKSIEKAKVLRKPDQSK